MSLEEQLAANTAAIKELTAALLAGGIVKNAQATAEAHSSPAVQAVVKAQKAADAKKPEPEKAAAAEVAAPASGEQSAPTGESSSSEPTELQPWAEKTAAKYAELKDAAPDLDSVRKAVLGINALIGRDQANAVLGRFGAQAVTAKDNKKGLDESQYADFFTLCLEVLSGKVDATASMVSE